MQLQRFQASPGNSLCSTDVLKGQQKNLNGQACSLCLAGQKTNKRQQQQEKHRQNQVSTMCSKWNAPA